MIRRIAIPLMLLSSCATPVPPPPEPTYTSVGVDMQQAAMLSGNPLITWQVADESVRAACFAFLNGAASQQTSLALGSLGVGAVGAGMTLAFPLAGLGASLAQTLLAGLSASGYVPTTADAIMVENYLNAYETAANAVPPTSNPMAVSWAVDEWYHCSPGGMKELEAQAKITAQMSFQVPYQPLLLRDAPMAPAPRRPIIRVNPNPAPPMVGP